MKCDINSVSCTEVKDRITTKEVDPQELNSNEQPLALDLDVVILSYMSTALFSSIKKRTFNKG